MRDCLFVWVPKVAGSSICRALSVHGMKKLNNNPSAFKGRGSVTFGHWSPDAVKKKFVSKEYWEEAYRVAFVRNPWDRMVSLFCYWKHITSVGKKVHPVIAATAKMSFKEFCLKLAEWDAIPTSLNGRSEGIYQACSQVLWAGDKEGLNFVGRYESLQDDFSRLCGCLGVKAKLPHENSGYHKHYMKFYDEETARIVGELYKDDVERFGYEFK